MTELPVRPRGTVIQSGGDLPPFDDDMENLVAAGCRLTVVSLLQRTRPDAVYRLEDRHGVGVLVVPTYALSNVELQALFTFTFAQYVAAGFIDWNLASSRGLKHEPLQDVDPDTLQFIAFSSIDGLLLASLAVQPVGARRPGARLSSRDRPLLPLEEHFGWGVFNRFALLPDMPIDRIREFGRLVRNTRLGPRRTLGIRAIVELCYAASRVLMAPLRMTVDAFVGEFENDGIRPQLEFFHTPLAVLRGGLPVFAGEHLLQPALTGHDRHPFAVLVSDMRSMDERLAAIERALDRPADRVLTALAALKEMPSRATSTLIPAGGLPALCDSPMPQSHFPVQARRAARARGARLQGFRPFATLSDIEATTLGTFIQVRHVTINDHVITRGERSDGLFMVDHGMVERLGDRGPDRMMSDGDCFGIDEALTGAPVSATIVARRSTTLLCLSQDTYRDFLRDLKEVDLELHRMALATSAAGRYRGRQETPP